MKLVNCYGIVTSWDVTRAMAEGKTALADIESHNVVTAKPDEPLEIASKRMAQNNISALPVIDIEKKVLGNNYCRRCFKTVRTVNRLARILIRFDENQVSEPIASQIIIEYKVPMAILSAHS